MLSSNNYYRRFLCLRKVVSHTYEAIHSYFTPARKTCVCYLQVTEKMQMWKSWSADNFPRKHSKPPRYWQTRLEKPKRTTYTISELKDVLFLPTMFSERGKYTRDAETILKFWSFSFFYQSSALNLQFILNDQHTTALWGTHHMAHFNRVNCTLWHEWNCSMYTVNHQFQGFARMGITLCTAATPRTSRASGRASTVRWWLLFCTSEILWITTGSGSTLPCMTQDFIRVFSVQQEFYNVLFHTVSLHNTPNFKF